MSSGTNRDDAGLTVSDKAKMCNPISIIWGPDFPNGCIALLPFNYFNAAFHILTDLLLAFLPIPILKSLKINRRRKGKEVTRETSLPYLLLIYHQVGLAIVFAVGLLTIVITVARQVTNAIALTNIDFPW